MRKIIANLFGILLLSNWTVSAFAQSGYTFFSPKGSFAIEISLQNPPFNLNRLPIYQNAITSLIVRNGHIIGGTSAKAGLSPYIFVASLSKRKLVHKKALNKIIPGQRSIQSGFCKGGTHSLYAGTLADTSKTKRGHLLKIDISKNGKINISDLGAPIRGEGIFALTCNAKGTMLYGISYPSGFFFKYDISTGNTKVYHSTAPSQKTVRRYYVGFNLKPKDYLGKRLIVANNGRVYGSMPVNKLFYYDPKGDSIHILKDHIPYVWGRHSLGRVESWAKAKDGTLYAGNDGDGQLFSIDPSNNRVTNLGKPIMMTHLRALVFAKNGRLYGIAGGKPGYSHLFYYEADGRGFVDLGNPQFTMKAPGILKNGISWRGFQIATLAASENDKYIVMGEDESLSQIMVFPVSSVMPVPGG
jgi:hypothetical protein